MANQIGVIAERLTASLLIITDTATQEYAWAANTKNFCSRLNPGDRIEFSIGKDGLIGFIKKIPATVDAQPVTTAATTTTTSSSSEITPQPTTTPPPPINQPPTTGGPIIEPEQSVTAPPMKTITPKPSTNVPLTNTGLDIRSQHYTTDALSLMCCIMKLNPSMTPEEIDEKMSKLIPMAIKYAEILNCEGHNQVAGVYRD
jgi:hypothetical protein